VSAQALTVAMFGGVGTVWGPVIGALVLVPLSAWLDAEFAEILPGIQGVLYGSAIIAVVVLAPEGVFWRIRDLLFGAQDASEPAAKSSAVAEPDPQLFAVPVQGGDRAVLEVDKLAKSFGGLRAVDDVSFRVERGEIVGLIGPNGAGKTTVFNLLNGIAIPDRGRVLLNGIDLVGRAPNQICRAGVGRTFQVVKPFRRMSILENVIIGAYGHTRHEHEARALALRALSVVGLEGDAGRTAGSIGNEKLRLVELARALAGKPSLLLLDEIFAGLSADEVDSLMSVVRRLAQLGITIVIIEHTMYAMVKLVDRFVVLDHGKVLAEGTPDEITKNPDVIGAYLGRKWMEHA
jgi:branched-chain amino acid transport system permease protein